MYGEYVFVIYIYIYEASYIVEVCSHLSCAQSSFPSFLIFLHVDAADMFKNSLLESGAVSTPSVSSAAPASTKLATVHVQLYLLHVTAHSVSFLFLKSRSSLFVEPRWPRLLLPSCLAAAAAVVNNFTTCCLP